MTRPVSKKKIWPELARQAWNVAVGVGPGEPLDVGAGVLGHEGSSLQRGELTAQGRLAGRFGAGDHDQERRLFFHA